MQPWHMNVFGPQQHETAFGQGQKIAFAAQHRQVARLVVRFQPHPMQRGIADPLRAPRDELQIDVAAMGFPKALARGLGVVALDQREQRIARQVMAAFRQCFQMGGAQERERLFE